MARTDRAAGAVVMAFALVLWLVVIPDQVDSADYGWMRPRTLPSIVTVALFLLGLILTLAPSGDATPDEAIPDRRIGLAIGLAGLGIFAMGPLGFAIAAPPMSAAAAWLVGERRWPMLIAAGALVPLAIWLLVEVLLGRPLP